MTKTKKDYAPGTSVLVKSATSNGHEVGTFIEALNDSVCSVELQSGRNITVSWWSLQEISEGPAERGVTRYVDYIARVGAWRDNRRSENYRRQFDLGELHRRLLVSDREREELHCQVRRLEERVIQLDNRCQQLEDFLRESNLPSGF
ncbi:unknown protein [Seminavis robusta]|uniref:Uncharacterized protein n=1 Tax=Seminavis robusta TaxID=568900 RepID=A0A9N8E5P4_9STRA|nr:unknown protein [Seminavis robusta]|eukprot:Sro647_g180930.1 n/a (147) ;mRNA; r:36876-37316